MRHSILTPEMLRIGNDMLDWSLNYLSKENKKVKRPRGNQVICPFVKPSIDNNSYYFAFHPEINGKGLQMLEELTLNYVDQFKKIGPFDIGSKYKKALILIFNNIPKDETNILDIVHKNVKDTFVASGLMIGQFHPHCNDRGIYNRKFKISRSPHPILAIRNMAIHDILFLKENRIWFMAYNTWFGQKFKKGELDENVSHLEEYYIQAKEKFNI